jgi:hypothetical protein
MFYAYDENHFISSRKVLFLWKTLFQIMAKPYRVNGLLVEGRLFSRLKIAFLANITAI